MSTQFDFEPAPRAVPPPAVFTPNRLHVAAPTNAGSADEDDDTVDFIDAPKGTRALLYLRVSSKRQVTTDYDPEGLSIPAQRAACERKAEQLGLRIVDEYVEPGRSGTEMASRVAFQQMLARIRREKDVDAVIVYKLSRFARNRTDDAIVMADLKKRGVTLISATESIDETPVGQLMHGILASFNEFRSREDGADISYKMGQKAKNGGTIGRAPLGYLNTIERFEGRDVRSIAVDPERAPFVKLAFELYAQRDYTLQMIADELTDRGLTTRRSSRSSGGPISISKVQTMLRDRYYLGEVRYRGEYFDGRHERLIDDELFQKVQELLDTRGVAGERQRRHGHYLKGTLACGRCFLEDESVRRMILMRAVGRHGNEYWYFFCRGVQEHVCDAPYSNIDRVEEAVAEHYKTIQFTAAFANAIRTAMTDAIADADAARQLLHKQIHTQIDELNVREDNLLDLASDGSLPQAKIRERLRQIAKDRERLEAQQHTVQEDISKGQTFLEAHLALLDSPYELYLHADETLRRKLNQLIFKRIYVVNEEVVGDEINSPLAELLATQQGYNARQAGASEDIARKVAVRKMVQISPKTKQGIPVRDALLGHYFAAAHIVGDCSMTSMVRLEGLEPPTF